jgi:hypothetical protein
MVPEADAIHNPRAVMVHFQDAALTDSTVMGPIWLVRRAPFAETAVSGGAFGLSGGNMHRGIPWLLSTIPCHQVQIRRVRKELGESRRQAYSAEPAKQSSATRPSGTAPLLRALWAW